MVHFTNVYNVNDCWAQLQRACLTSLAVVVFVFLSFPRVHSMPCIVSQQLSVAERWMRARSRRKDKHLGIAFTLLIARARGVCVYVLCTSFMIIVNHAREHEFHWISMASTIPLRIIVQIKAIITTFIAICTIAMGTSDISYFCCTNATIGIIHSIADEIVSLALSNPLVLIANWLSPNWHSL